MKKSLRRGLILVAVAGGIWFLGQGVAQASEEPSCSSPSGYATVVDAGSGGASCAAGEGTAVDNGNAGSSSENEASSETGSANSGDGGAATSENGATGATECEVTTGPRDSGASGDTGAGGAATNESETTGGPRVTAVQRLGTPR